jgi:hypothetical protein
LAATEHVSGNRILDSSHIEGLSLDDADTLVTLLNTCTDSLSLCEFPSPAVDEQALLVGQSISPLADTLQALHSAVNTRVAINRFVRPEPITDPMCTAYQALEFDAFSQSALDEADPLWSAARYVGIAPPLARVLECERNPRVHEACTSDGRNRKWQKPEPMDLPAVPGRTSA